MKQPLTPAAQLQIYLVIVAHLLEPQELREMLFQEIQNQVIRLHQGVEAEIATGQELSLLMRDGAWVFHDIPYQYGNIDHVIVSRGSIFAIETKGYSKPESFSFKSWKRTCKLRKKLPDFIRINPCG